MIQRITLHSYTADGDTIKNVVLDVAKTDGTRELKTVPVDAPKAQPAKKAKEK